MIRMFLFAAGFVAITLVLVIYQPGSSRPSRDLPEPVTRAEPAPLTPAVHEQAVAPATQTLARPAPRVIAPAPGTEPLDDQSLRRLTWDTLSNLNTATGRESAPGQPGSLLHTIVRRSLEDSGAPSAPQPVIVPEIYVVQEGDSLITIAEKVYGDVNMTGPLFAANQSFLTRPDDLRPGQRLVLPTP